MAEAYRTFGSYILFSEALADEIGHLYRAGEFDRSGVRRTVWLRVFDAPGTPSQDLLERFDAGNQIGEILQSSNIVGNPVYFAHGGTPAAACDHLASQPLSRVLAKVHEEGFPIPVDNALLIMEKLSLSLSAALAVEVSGSSLVHGFLHPALIFVTNDGEGLVSGFGVADQLLGLIDQPGAGEAIQPYLAPEILMTRNPSRSGDVYSLGAILYHLLTAEPLPAAPEARAGVLDRAELAYDEQLIPEDIKGLLARTLATRPEDRFSSAADFKKELDKLLYGGAYSPTTFNLALFMDRLFRSEIEIEERERTDEAGIDVTSYLQPEPAPEPVEVATPPPPVAAASQRKGLFIGVAAGLLVVAAVVVVFLIGRGPSGSAATPTPTPEEVAAQREAEAAKLKAMVEAELQRMMAEKEEEITAELVERQGKIDELQKKLRDLERSQRQKGATESAAAKRNREALQQQLAAEEEAKVERERKLEEERQRALEEARRKALAAAQTAQQQARPTSATPILGTTASQTAVPPTEGPAVPEPTEVARLEPTPEPVSDQPDTVITENMFLEPSQVDSLPAVLRDQAVIWTRGALSSRRRGVIILQATVTANGKVEDVKVLRADHGGFGIPQSASSAVQKYLFKPATKNGVKVKSYATVTIPYRFQTR